MPRFRDAETGEYISKEDAENRDPATWVEEEDSPDDYANVKLLKEIYRRAMANSITPVNSISLNGVTSLPLEKLRVILNDYGADIPE